MNSIKFVCKDEPERLFAIAVKKNVNDYFKERALSKKANLPMVIQTIVMLSLYIVPFILLLTIPMGVWSGMLLAIIMGIGMGGIGMCVMHDAVHGSYSHKDWINKILGGSMYLLGSNVFNWRIQHNVLHHSYTNIEGNDQDIESNGPIRLSQHAPLRKIHHYQYVHAFFFMA